MDYDDSEASRFPFIYGFAQSDVIPCIAPVVIAPYGRYQDMPIMVPEILSDKAYDFIEVLYKPVVTVRPDRITLRLFRFDQIFYVMVVFVTSAIEKNSGRTGLRLSLGAALTQNERKMNCYIAGSYLETMFYVFNRLFSVSLPTSGAEVIIDKVQKTEAEPTAVEPFHAAKDTLLLAAETLGNLGRGTVRRWPYKIDQKLVGRRAPRMIIHRAGIARERLMAIVIKEILAASEVTTIEFTPELESIDLAGEMVQMVAVEDLPETFQDVRVRACGSARYLALY